MLFEDAPVGLSGTVRLGILKIRMNAERGYSTPEEAAMGGFDPRYARVILTRYVNDDLAEVELETNTPEAPYPYFVVVTRTGGVWFERSSSNGPSYPEAEPR